MSVSDCPDCWDTPCVCKTGYLGSKIFEYNKAVERIKVLEKEVEELMKTDYWQDRHKILKNILQEAFEVTEYYDRHPMGAKTAMSRRRTALVDKLREALK